MKNNSKPIDEYFQHVIQHPDTLSFNDCRPADMQEKIIEEVHHYLDHLNHFLSFDREAQFFHLMLRFNGLSNQHCCNSHFIEYITATDENLTDETLDFKFYRLLQFLPLVDMDIVTAVDDGTLGQHNHRKLLNNLFDRGRNTNLASMTYESHLGDLIRFTARRALEVNPARAALLTNLYCHLAYEKSPAPASTKQIGLFEKLTLGISAKESGITLNPFLASQYNYFVNDHDADNLDWLVRETLPGHTLNIATELCKSYVHPSTDTHRPPPLIDFICKNPEQRFSFLESLIENVDYAALNSHEQDQLKDTLFRTVTGFGKDLFVNYQTDKQSISRMQSIIHQGFSFEPALGKALFYQFLQLPMVHRSWKQVLKTASQRGWDWNEVSPDGGNGTYLECMLDRFNDPEHRRNDYRGSMHKYLMNEYEKTMVKPAEQVSKHKPHTDYSL